MTDPNTNIQQFKDQVSKFTKERNWEKFYNPKNLSMSIAIEASELMEIFQWLNEKESWNIMNSSEAIHLEEEDIDELKYFIRIYLNYIQQTHGDISEDELIEKIEKIEGRLLR